MKLRRSFAVLRTIVLTALFAVSSAHAELAVVSRFPTGENACLDTPLRLTFNAAPIVSGPGKLEVVRSSDDVVVARVDLAASQFVDRFGANGGFMLHYEPIWVSEQTAKIRLPAHVLNPEETYYVRVARGMFADADGKFTAPVGAWTFRTRAAMPRNPDRVVVAADGSGDFCTIQGAVDQIEPHRDAPAEIFVRRGYYHELVRIGRERRRIHLRGEDREGTVLAYTNNEKLNTGWIQRAVLGCEADDFVLENMTVRNTTPYKGSQAEAVTINAERCILRNANFLSFQDTLNLSGRVYVADCYIEGDVDYVWGYGSALFERCELRTLHDGFIVQARNSAARPGYVFNECRLTAGPEAKRVWLARVEPARFPASHVTSIRCAMSPHIVPAAWQITGGPAETLQFEEFASTDEHGNPLDVTKREAAGRQIREAQARERIEGVLRGSDGWKPR